MSTAFGGLVGLLAGFLLGLGLAAVPTPATATIVGIFATIGAIFIDLIRMTVLPLVTSLLVSSLGSAAGSSGLGRAGVRAVVGGALLLIAAIAISLLVARPLLDRVQVDRDAAIALRNASTPAAAAPGPSTLPTIAQWARELVPVNVIRSAADGLILPVVIFSVIFGLALAKVESSHRDPVLNLATGIAEVMQRIVAGLLRAAPSGIFALAVPLASGLGVTAAAAVFAYIGVAVGLLVAATLLLYPLGVVAARLSPAAFVSYCAPAQALAFTSRSSLAALPSMLECAAKAGLPARATAVMPIALSTFHVGAAVAQTVGALFVARVYDIALAPMQTASLAVAVFFASIAVPGVPGGSIIAMAPVLLSAGLPPEGLGILLAVDAVPDMFRTTANVTGALTLTAVAVSTDD
jgi:proton glutamate symport protein